MIEWAAAYKYSELHSAVIVSSNYRLIPESTVQDAIDDADDTLLWIRNYLQAEVAIEVPFAIDTNRILATGDSVGGYLSSIVALKHPDIVRSAIAAYPMVFVDDPHFVGKYEKEVLGLPMVAPELVPDHLEKVKAAKEDHHFSWSTRPAIVPYVWYHLVWIDGGLSLSGPAQDLSTEEAGRW
ncbi:Alpha/Beta hydrolase protein [Fusarium oxysporum f. sp. albedinis]|nr:Alpha/Beta hydrolase protein [Fusarium oxysporum f. sp. albedinis]